MYKIIDLEEFTEFINEIASYTQYPETVAAEAIKYIELADDAD